jgi:phospholipid/cholesterol/gamma-HCH transport system substrate-binding protein
MKVSNETKVGALTAIAITILILGFNFLKGKNLLSKANSEMYAVFNKVDGLAVSNPVTINGLQIGKIYEMQEKSRRLNDGVVVTINLIKDVDIPKNSFAVINRDLLGAASVNITLGTDNENLKNGDTILSRNASGLMDEVKGALNPALNQVNGAVKSLDSLLEVVGTYFDPATKVNFHAIVGNLTKSSAELKLILDSQNSTLAKSLANVNSITGNLAKNNDKVTKTLENLETTTNKFAALKLDETMTGLQTTLGEIKGIMAKANSKDGSLGLLLNDPKLYKNLESTTYKLNILLDDLRTHPKRYINVSVFGKKDKNSPLASPLVDDTLNLPLPKKQ